ncbi:MAG TPA: hypothetical protein DIT07_10005, partial [Sphingobacteriaceae bacterium]|nr:hypothetical protein [Sphingobacteriaceae bacterium]
MIKTKFQKAKNLGLLSLMVLFVSLSACTAMKNHSNIKTVTVKLSGANEVPANNSTGSGIAVIAYKTDMKIITYNISWTLGSSTATTTNMHFHGADNGSTTTSSPVQIGITGFSKGSSGTISGMTVTLTDAQAAQLLAGKWYVNIHSSTVPGGEIRGNIIF